MNQVGFNSVFALFNEKITEFHKNSINVIAYGEPDFRTFEFIMYKFIANFVDFGGEHKVLAKQRSASKRSAIVYYKSKSQLLLSVCLLLRYAVLKC